MSISSKSSPEEVRGFRQQNEPSNIDVIGAFAPSDHLQLFCVGNKAQDTLYVLASTWRNAEIIAIAPDTLEHAQSYFKQNDIPFPCLADPDRQFV